MPLLRYRTGDIGSMTLEPCACGRTTARIRGLPGRRDDMNGKRSLRCGGRSSLRCGRSCATRISPGGCHCARRAFAGETGESPYRHTDWCAANGHEVSGARWEIYGHWLEDQNPALFETEVYWLFKIHP